VVERIHAHMRLVKDALQGLMCFVCSSLFLSCFVFRKQGHAEQVHYHQVSHKGSCRLRRYQGSSSRCCGVENESKRNGNSCWRFRRVRIWFCVFVLSVSHFFKRYVVCKSSDPSFSEHCRHPSEVRKAEGLLEIDKDWYIQHQILPPITRLCAPIAGTDAQQLAFNLGLDLAKYPVYAKGNADEPQFNYNYLSLEEKFAECEKLSLKCSGCNVFSTIVGVVQKVRKTS
jgi:hypothetical protein